MIGNLTVDQYKHLNRTIKEESANPIDIINKKIMQVHILTGKPIDEVEKIPTAKLKKILKEIDKPLPSKIKKTFKLNGVKYRVITRPKELNGGRYISIMDSIKQNSINNLHIVLFNVCEPLKLTWRGWKPYEFKDAEAMDRLEDFRQLKLKIAYPISVFFCKVSKSLTINMLDRSHEELKKMRKELIKFNKGLIDGAGFYGLTGSQKETLQNGINSIK